MSKVIQGRGYVYSLQYHLVWCVKYRRKVLVNGIEKSLKEILIQLCKDHEITIEEMETDQDHIHMLISLKPQHYIPTVVKTLKGNQPGDYSNSIPKSKDFSGEVICGILAILSLQLVKILKNRFVDISKAKNKNNRR